MLYSAIRQASWATLPVLGKWRFLAAHEAAKEYKMGKLRAFTLVELLLVVAVVVVIVIVVVSAL